MLNYAEYMAILRADFLSFIQRSFHELNPETDFIESPHVDLIASELEKCRLGQTRRLIITLPPRSLKSHTASIAFPAWCLGHNPAQQLICVSYGQDLAEKFARDSRALMRSDWYRRLFTTRIANRQAVSDFTTTDHGNRMSTSVGGVLTGRGGDIILIDDPLKPDEALSETRRPAVNDWYDNTLRSRLNDKRTGCIIIIMQRLHQDDLVGHVFEQEDWKVVSFPSIAVTDEERNIDSVLGRRSFIREVGEALQAEREPLEVLAGIRRSIGDYNFLSQYQQDPAPAEGAIVKMAWLIFYEPGEQPARFSRIVQSWDTANKANELSDYSVCTTWGVIFGKYYLLDVFRKKLNYPELKRAVIEKARQTSANTILIEDKASGTQLIQELRHAGVFGVKDYTPPSGNDKIMRLHSQTTMFENGHVLLPRSAPWLAEYIKELTGFPGAKYDDQVDSTTQALDYLRSTYSSLEVWERLGKGSSPNRYRR